MQGYRVTFKKVNGGKENKVVAIDKIQASVFELDPETQANIYTSNPDDIGYELGGIYPLGYDPLEGID